MSGFEFTQETKDIIANFSAINPSILFREGNTIKTISPSKDIFAVANVSEVFPKEFAIYDLSRLLGVLTLFEKGTQITFKDKQMLIKGEGERKVNYTYAEPSMIIVAPDKNINHPDVIAEFDVSEKVLKD